MKKFVFLLTIVVVAFGFAVFISAGTVKEEQNDPAVSERTMAKVQAIVDDANLKIEAAIAEAVSKADTLEDAYLKGELTQQQKDAKLNKLVGKLVEKTDRIAEKAKEKGERLGIQIGCEYEQVFIGGLEVFIDPLFIIGT